VKAPVVRLKIRVRLPDGSRPFLDPVLSGNGKLKPLYALIQGNAEHHPEGTYFLRYGKNGKRVWERVGNDAQLALTAKQKREKSLEAKAVGVELVEDAPVAGKQTPLTEAVAEYLAEVKNSKAIKTYLAYSLTLRQFREAVRQESLEAIDRKDVLTFIAFMRSKGNGPRTIANRVAYLKGFFHRFGLNSPLLKTDKVRYTEKVVSGYSMPELQTLFAAADQEEHDLFQFFLCTGCRDGEVQHATWADIDFHRNLYTVKERLDLGFRPKDKEEGSIPLPDDFVARMKARRARSNSRLIFLGARGTKDVHFLRILKRLAYRAGLNCGQCYNKAGRCCADHAICERFGLHRFRKTFATMHHEAGVSARTIQRWLRHSSLDTTLRYLAGSDDQSEKTRGLVNSTFAAVGGGK
jgi:integrase/recombinase XerD